MKPTAALQRLSRLVSTLRGSPSRTRRVLALSVGFLCVVLCCSRADAQLNRHLPMPPTIPPAPTSMLVAEHARYEATFAGVRAYMAELAQTDRARHDLLEPTFAALRRRRRCVAGAGAALVFLGLAAVAMALSFDDDLGRTTRIGTMYGGATASFVGGAMLGVLGGRHDAERFVEAHQRLVPRARLHIELTGGARSAQLLARARF